MEAFLLENLPILLCFLFGVVLLIVEVFMPGFGLPGISGIILEGAAIVLTYLWHGGLAALGVTVLILAIVAVAISLALRSANRGRLSKSNIILKEAETAENGYSATSAADMQVFVGRKGVTSTPLRPTGLAEFDGVRLNVASQGDFIPKDTPVIVDHVEGASLSCGGCLSNKASFPFYHRKEEKTWIFSGLLSTLMATAATACPRCGSCWSSCWR